MTGRVVRGLGEAGKFLAIPWVEQALAEALGASPLLGTLNLEVSSQDRDVMAKAASSRPLPSPDPAICDSVLYAVFLRSRDGREVPGVWIFPDVADYPPGQIEIVAAVHCRSALGLGEGDALEIVPRSEFAG